MAKQVAQTGNWKEGKAKVERSHFVLHGNSPNNQPLQPTRKLYMFNARQGTAWAGQGTVRQGRAGKVGHDKGRQGTAGQGRAGQGRAEQSRAGQGK